MIARRLSFLLFLGSLSFDAACSADDTETSTSANPSFPEGPAAKGDNEAPPSDADLPVSAFCAQVKAKGVARGFIDFLHPVPSADYVAQLAALHPHAYAGQDDEFRIAGEIGARCGGASDVAACTSAYDTIPTITAPARTCFTRGDEVGCLDTKAAAMGFLGEVRSVEEAMFIASYDGNESVCFDDRIIARGKELAGGTFRLALVRDTGCAGHSDRVVIDVSRDGTTTLRKSWQTDVGFGCW